MYQTHMSSSSSINRHRAYIRNLSYSTTEDDLEELFKKYNPISVLIPSYTIRFTRSDRQRPLGIAYAEFKSREDLDAVVKEFDGTTFKKRQMSVKKHVAYDPKRRFFILGKNPSINKEEPPAKVEAKIKPTPKEPKIEISKTKITTTAVDTTSVSGVGSRSELSTDTVFIPKAPAKVSDESLRTFFKDYGPAQIYILTPRKPKRGAINLKGSYVSVLAKLDSTQTNLDDIIFKLKSQKLDGKHVVIKPAYKSKIEEITSRLKLTSNERRSSVANTSKVVAGFKDKKKNEEALVKKAIITTVA